MSHDDPPGEADPSSTTCPQRPAESPRLNSRAALIDAAFEEFSTKGYESATVAGIAERAGVTTGALYTHFDGKVGLLIETLGLTPVEDVMRSIADIASQPWSEVSKSVGRRIAARPDRRTLLLLDLIVVARRDPQVARILRQGLEGYMGVTVRATTGGVALGMLDPALGPDDLARVLALMNLGMLVFAALDEPSPSEQAFGRIADLLLQSAGASDDGQPAALARVRGRAATAERARRALRDGIVEAVGEGHSLRQVAGAAGLSHERVRQILRERDESA
ncbi:MAG TPA: helix-turn-helix domain-containing protein [Acidimicrobiales bacterium]|jgi:AcrR family transcriptional regulator